MFRTLFDFGPFSIHMYGVMLAIAFWLAIELSARSARRRGLDETRIVDLGIVVLISSIAGSRLLYVLAHMSDYHHDKLGVFRVWEGGLTFYGGLLAGIVFGVGYLRWKRLPVARVTDIIAPQIALGVSIARIGCFLNGCCFGKASNLPWACTFPENSQAGWVMAGQAMHPTQLYSAVANFVLFLFLRRLIEKTQTPGRVFHAFLVAYGVWRFAIDFLRHYEENMYLGIAGRSLTYNQLVSVAIVVIGVVLVLRTRTVDAALRKD